MILWYGPDVMSKHEIRLRCQDFSEGMQNVHYEQRYGLPSFVDYSIAEPVLQFILKNFHFPTRSLNFFSDEDLHAVEINVIRWFHKNRLQKLIPWHYKCYIPGGYSVDFHDIQDIGQQHCMSFA